MSLPQAWLSTWRHLGDAGAGAREHRHPGDLQRQEGRLGRLRQLDLWGRISQRQELYRQRAPEICMQVPHLWLNTKLCRSRGQALTRPGKKPQPDSRKLNHHQSPLRVGRSPSSHDLESSGFPEPLRQPVETPTKPYLGTRLSITRGTPTLDHPNKA